jgi:histidyl-tRNA synthetase
MAKDVVIGKSGQYRVQPRLARGFRDLAPQQMFTRNRVIDVIRKICELYGYVPLYTPAVERLDVLMGSAGEKREVILRVDVDDPPERFGLRFDLTIPLARVVAQGTPLPLPFRRYQVAAVWRAGDGGESHEREFTMFDLDAVGVGSEVADTEIIAAMCDTLRALDVGRFTVRYSNRELLKSLFTLAEIPERSQRRVMEIISSRDQNGLEKRRALLTQGHREGTGPFVPGVDLTSSQADSIEAFLAIRSTSRAEVIGRLKDLFANASYASAGIEVIERISAQLGALGFGDEVVEIDLSVVRSHTYYTGPVFEATLSGAEQFGAIFFGG